MKIINTTELALSGVKTIKFERFYDHRGYFTETYNKKQLAEVFNTEVVQINESVSKEHVVRGLHFQWNPYMGKLVRTIKGHMVDLVLDIRKDSPTYGKAIAHDMPVSLEFPSESEWIWVPPGFAHGNYFKEPTMIEYLCTGAYSPGCEACISPRAGDVDWSLCDPTLRSELKTVLADNAIITDKDSNGLTLAQWEKKKEFNNFTFANLKDM